MGTKDYVLQKQDELSESRQLARASFLTSILRLRQNIITDLWNTTLPEFKRVVLVRFRSEISDGIDLEKYEKEKDEEFRRTPLTCGDYLVHLLQHKLSPRYIDTGEPDPVRHEFFCYAKLKEAGYTVLVKGIDEWSRKSNLDADWCRDHAIEVLRAWLFNREIRWVGVFPSRLQPVQLDGWRTAVADLENNALFSRVLIDVDLETHADAPEPFVFNLDDNGKSLCFEATWNIVSESEARFKKRIQLDLKLLLNEDEAKQLSLLRREEMANSVPVKEFQKRLALTNPSRTVAKQFGRQLKHYIAKMNAWKNKAKAKHHLVEALCGPRREHSEWLVLYQIPGPTGACLSNSSIVKSANAIRSKTLTIDNVRKANEKLAKQIDLRLRNPHQHAGRPTGSAKQKND